jgi:hypothetical protein
MKRLHISTLFLIVVVSLFSGYLLIDSENTWAAPPMKSIALAPVAPNAATLVGVKINFQPVDAPTPTNYLADSGEVKGNRGGGWTYGWATDHTANTGDRDINDDQRLDTLVLDTSAVALWEVDVPSGRYKLTIAMGDAENAQDLYLDVEGSNWWNITAKPANQFQIETHYVTIADGNISLEIKGPLNYIDIVPAPAQGTFLDWGDAPDSYKTTLADNGPRHTYSEGLYLGGIYDDETNGVPSANADGDDTADVDDEDGVVKQFEISTADSGFKRRWTIGVTVPSGVTANVYGWIDLDRNGSFDADEIAMTTATGADTAVTLEWTIHPPISPGTSYARFRITTDNLTHNGGNNDPDQRAIGSASDGEVEDYVITIRNFGTPLAGCLDSIFQSRAQDVGYHFQYAELLVHQNPIDENVLYGPSPHISDLVASPDDFNALGLNDNDEYIYAWYFDFTHGARPVEWSYLTRIRALNGEMQILGDVLANGPQDVAHGAVGSPVVNHYDSGEPLRETFLAGDMDDSDFYYATAINLQSLVKIDIKNMTFTSVPLTEGGSQVQLGTNDIAYNSQDGYFYAVREVAHSDPNFSSLLKISTTGVITETLLDGKVPGGQGGAIMDPAYTLYALINNDGQGGPFQYYSVDVSDPTPNLAYLGPGKVNLRANDGAGCLVPRDYGDLPDTYLTKEASGGARHNLYDFNKDGIVDLYLGAGVDPDRDGWVDVIDDSGNAMDDDAATDPTGKRTGNGDDEDGVSLITPLIPDENACVKVSAHNADPYDAAFHGWIDFDSSGTFTNTEGLTGGSGGTGGNFNASQAFIPSGDTSDKTYCFKTPSTANFATGVAAMRFRISMEYLNPSRWGGFVDEGEVEDYMTKLACIGNYVWDDTNGSTPNVQDSNDTPISGLTVRLVAAGVNGTIDTAATDSAVQGDDYLYTTTTDSNGRYTFCGVPPGVIQIQIPTPPASAPQAVSPNSGSDDALDSDGTPTGGANAAISSPVITYSEPISITVVDNASNDTDPTGYPDNQTDLAIDFGFQAKRVAIGNRVWNDADNDGVFDLVVAAGANSPYAETGIDGAKLNLYRDSDGDDICEPGSDTFVTTTTTSGGGFYQFLNLAPSNTSDKKTNYCVALDTTSVKPTYSSSSTGGGGNPDAGDNNDDGIPVGTFVVTKPFAALLNSQSTSDSGDPLGYDDNSSYMTVDFGLNTDPNRVHLAKQEPKPRLNTPGIALLLVVGLAGLGVVLRHHWQIKNNRD